MEETIKVLEKLDLVYEELQKDEAEGHSSAYEMQTEDFEAIETLLQAYKEDERVIEEACKELGEYSYCPRDLDNCPEKRLCDLCWKDYFRNKVREENKE